MSFLTIMGVTGIICSFRLVLDGKTGKEINEPSRLQFLQMFSADNFALSDAADNTSRPLNRGGIADLPLMKRLLAICQKPREPGLWEVINSFVLLAYSSLAASRTLLQRSLICLNFSSDSVDSSFWYKRQKWFPWTMAEEQAAENHRDEWGLTWYLQWGIYTSILTWTFSRNSPAAIKAELNDILPLNIS